MEHVFDPLRSGSKDPKVHYEDPGGLILYCRTSNSRIFTVVDGDRIRIWHRTKRPVTCTACTKKQELTIKEQLRKLNAEQLEDIAAHIDTFVNRYTPVPPIA